MNRESFQNGKELALRLEPEEQLELMEKLARSLRSKSKRPPKRMFGAWKDELPDDVDIDKILKEIRSEWEKEIDEL